MKPVYDNITNAVDGHWKCFYTVHEFLTTFNEGQHFSWDRAYTYEPMIVAQLNEQGYDEVVLCKDLIECRAKALAYYKAREAASEPGEVKFHFPTALPADFVMGENAAHYLSWSISTSEINSGEIEYNKHPLDGENFGVLVDSRSYERLVYSDLGLDSSRLEYAQQELKISIPHNGEQIDVEPVAFHHKQKLDNGGHLIAIETKDSKTYETEISDETWEKLRG